MSSGARVHSTRQQQRRQQRKVAAARPHQVRADVLADLSIILQGHAELHQRQIGVAHQRVQLLRAPRHQGTRHRVATKGRRRTLAAAVALRRRRRRPRGPSGSRNSPATLLLRLLLRRHALLLLLLLLLHLLLLLLLLHLLLPLHLLHLLLLLLLLLNLCLSHLLHLQLLLRRGPVGAALRRLLSPAAVDAKHHLELRAHGSQIAGSWCVARGNRRPACCPRPPRASTRSLLLQLLRRALVGQFRHEGGLRGLLFLDLED